MKKLNALNLGKSLNRSEMKNINGGTDFESAYTCACGTEKPVRVWHCGCTAFCEGTCTD